MWRLALVALLLAAGCSKPSDPAAAPPPAPSPAQAPVNPDVTVTTYACAGGEQLVAGYPDRETAVVTWHGHAYTLKSGRAGSGARYTGYGMQWWTKGLGRGRLSTLKPGEEVASDPGVECIAPELAPAEPPRPGAPGGLPDDRTPISEAPFTPTSPQGAADVVQTYYALLETGKAAQAGALREDGQAVDLRPYASYHAQVGAPGTPEGAAGSIYIEVPVVTYGRFADGREFHQSGEAVLRRVNDVPGATPAQLRWRIVRIELKP